MNNIISPSLRRGAAAGLLLIAPVVLFGTWWVLRHDLPDPLATHWDLSGTADGFSSTGPFVLGSTLVVLALAVAGLGLLVIDRNRASARTIVAVVAFLAWLLAAAGATTLVAARGLTDPHDAHSDWVSMVGVLLVATGAAVLTWWLVPAGESRIAAARLPDASYVLTPGERVTWVGTASSPTLLTVSMVTLVASGLLYVVIGTWALIGLATAVLIAWTSSLTVRVDAAGVTAHFGPFARPSWHTPLERIRAAAVEEIDPMKWGGWGYRLSRRGTAIVVRGGPGLVLSRAGGSDLAITVDHPEDGAELVNALLVRSRS